MTAGRDDFMRLRDNIWRVITDPRYPDPLRRKKGELMVLLLVLFLGVLVLAACFLTPFQTRWMAARVGLPDVIYQGYFPVPALDQAESVIVRLSRLADWRMGWMGAAVLMGLLGCLGRFRTWKPVCVGLSMLLLAFAYLEVQRVDAFQVGLLSHWGMKLSENSFHVLNRLVYMQGILKAFAIIVAVVLLFGFAVKWIRGRLSE